MSRTITQIFKPPHLSSSFLLSISCPKKFSASGRAPPAVSWTEQIPPTIHQSNSYSNLEEVPSPPLLLCLCPSYLYPLHPAFHPLLFHGLSIPLDGWPLVLNIIHSHYLYSFYPHLYTRLTLSHSFPNLHCTRLICFNNDVNLNMKTLLWTEPVYGSFLPKTGFSNTSHTCAVFFMNGIYIMLQILYRYWWWILMRC